MGRRQTNTANGKREGTHDSIGHDCYPPPAAPARNSLPSAAMASGPTSRITGARPGPGRSPHLPPSLLSLSLVHPTIQLIPSSEVLFFWFSVVDEETFGRGRRCWKGSRLIKVREKKSKSKKKERRKPKLLRRSSWTEFSPALWFLSQHIASREVRIPLPVALGFYQMFSSQVAWISPISFHHGHVHRQPRNFTWPPALSMLVSDRKQRSSGKTDERLREFTELSEASGDNINK